MKPSTEYNEKETIQTKTMGTNLNKLGSLTLLITQRKPITH